MRKCIDHKNALEQGAMKLPQQAFANANGVATSSPGLFASASYPGWAKHSIQHPQRGCGTTPLGLISNRSVTQGRSPLRPTLGYATKPRWGFQLLACSMLAMIGIFGCEKSGKKTGAGETKAADAIVQEAEQAAQPQTSQPAIVMQKVKVAPKDKYTKIGRAHV